MMLWCLVAKPLLQSQRSVLHVGGFVLDADPLQVIEVLWLTFGNSNLQLPLQIS